MPSSAKCEPSTHRSDVVAGLRAQGEWSEGLPQVISHDRSSAKGIERICGRHYECLDLAEVLYIRPPQREPALGKQLHVIPNFQSTCRIDAVGCSLRKDLEWRELILQVDVRRQPRWGNSIYWL